MLTAATSTFSSTVSSRNRRMVWKVRARPACADLVGLLVGDVHAVHKDLPAGGRQQAGDDIDQGGLAGAVRTDQAEDLAAPQSEADAVQGAQAGEVLG